MFVLVNGEIWDKGYYDREYFYSHVDIYDGIRNAEIAAHLENERREAEKRDAELCHEYW